MMHLFRPTDGPVRPTPPVGASGARLWAVMRQLPIARVAAVVMSGLQRVMVGRLLVLVGVLSQVALLLVTAYMVDLCISLMELWAALARKHLELTL